MKLSFKSEGKIKTFTDKQKLRKLIASRLAPYTDRTVRINRLIHYNSWRLQHHSIRNGQTQQAKNQKDKGELNHTIKQLDIKESIEYFIKQQQNTHSSQVHMKHPHRLHPGP